MECRKIDYETLRQKYRPDTVRVLLIAESPPIVTECEQPRFFYDVGTKTADYLYLEIMSVLFYKLTKGTRGERQPTVTNKLRQAKGEFLEAFQKHGFWLIDAVPEPSKLNRLAIEQNAAEVCRIVKAASPEGCVLIKKSVFNALVPRLKAIGVRVYNDNPLPFPATGHGAEFRKAFGTLLEQNGYRLPLRL